MMKTLIFFLIFFTCTSNSNATVIDAIIYTNEGKFDFGMIYNNEFYSPIRPLKIGIPHYVRKTELFEKSIPFLHISGGVRESSISSGWDISGRLVFSYDVLPSHHAGSRLGLTVNIVYREFESRDSVVVSQGPPQRIIENTVIVMPVATYFAEIRHAFGGHHDNIENAVNEFYDYLNFDIFFDTSDSLLNFYMRDKDAFYIWQAPLPIGRSWDTDWSLKKAYAAPHYDPEFIPRTHNEFYDSLKTQYDAITDTLFFDGHFKVLEQDGEKYFINREHAIIYHMGEKEITPIGRVLVTEDYPKIQGKPLFIFGVSQK